MLGLFVSLALLGLSAVDPIGIAAMPILLLQPHPFKRSFIFLGGSFASLIVMGLLFAKGFGQVVLRFEKSHPLLVPGAETMAGVILLGIAIALLWRLKSGRLSVDPPASLVERLQLGDWQLLIVGALLVGIQSVVDVVFVVAMIRVGQIQLQPLVLLTAVATYAATALLLQLIVVLAYKLSPPKQRAKSLEKVHGLLVKYANQVVVGISFLLGCTLVVLAAKTIVN